MCHSPATTSFYTFSRDGASFRALELFQGRRGEERGESCKNALLCLFMASHVPHCFLREQENRKKKIAGVLVRVVPSSYLVSI